jgi:hypothetical protein
VAVSRCSRSRKADCTDDDENDRIRVAERKITAAHLVEKKKHADGNNDGGPHQPANRATAASASDTVTHQRILLRAAVEPFAHHQNSRGNQNSRPKKL